jgi:CBS domain-containing protein
MPMRHRAAEPSGSGATARIESRPSSGFFPKRGSAPVPERAKIQIAHLTASSGLEDVELSVDCPGCGRSILVDIAHAGGLATAFGWQIGAPTPDRAAAGGPAAHDGERHIHAVMRADSPAVQSHTAIGMLPEVFESAGAVYVVVVDEGSRPIAVVSPLDLFREVGTRSAGSIAGLTLLDVAKTPAAYLRTDTRVSSALRLFAERRPACIVAVSDSGRFAGLVTPADLLDFLAR